MRILSDFWILLYCILCTVAGSPADRKDKYSMENWIQQPTYAKQSVNSILGPLESSEETNNAKLILSDGIKYNFIAKNHDLPKMLKQFQSDLIQKEVVTNFDRKENINNNLNSQFEVAAVKSAEVANLEDYFSKYNGNVHETKRWKNPSKIRVKSKKDKEIRSKEDIKKNANIFKEHTIFEDVVEDEFQAKRGLSKYDFLDKMVDWEQKGESFNSRENQLLSIPTEESIFQEEKFVDKLVDDSIQEDVTQDENKDQDFLDGTDTNQKGNDSVEDMTFKYQNASVHNLETKIKLYESTIDDLKTLQDIGSTLNNINSGLSDQALNATTAKPFDEFENLWSQKDVEKNKVFIGNKTFDIYDDKEMEGIKQFLAAQNSSDSDHYVYFKITEEQFARGDVESKDLYAVHLVLVGSKEDLTQTLKKQFWELSRNDTEAGPLSVNKLEKKY